MVTKNRSFDKEFYIKRVKDAGESLIKNAESIVGDEKYFYDLQIIIDFGIINDEIPNIEIRRQFYPEKTIEKW